MICPGWGCCDYWGQRPGETQEANRPTVQTSQFPALEDEKNRRRHEGKNQGQAVGGRSYFVAASRRQGRSPLWEGEGTLSNTRRRSTGPKSEGWAEQYR